MNWNNENNEFFILLISAVLVVYFAPFILNQAFFAGVLILAFRSKKDYFWVAFLFVLLEAPGRLFAGGDIADLKRLAFYPLAGGITLQFTDLFELMLIAKVISTRSVSNFILKKNFAFLITYGLVVIAYSILLGVNNTNLIQSVRLLLSWSLFWSIPSLLKTQSQFDNLNRLIFPFVFLAILSQFYTYQNGNYFADQLKGASTVSERLLVLTASSTETLRAADSSILLLYATTQALVYFLGVHNVFSRRYLILVIFTSGFSVFLSATRGWILGFGVLFLLTFIFVSRSKRYIFNVLLVSSIVFSVIYFSFPMISFQIDNVINRVATIGDLAEGDVTAGGTLSRLDIRGPRVLEKFYERPILGWGFSDQFYAYFDRHIGHHSILLNVGVVGYLIFNLLFFSWCLKIWQISKNRLITMIYGVNAVKILVFSLLAIYTIHSSSAQGYGFDISVAQILFYAFILQLASVIDINTKRVA